MDIKKVEQYLNDTSKEYEYWMKRFINCKENATDYQMVVGQKAMSGHEWGAILRTLDLLDYKVDWDFEEQMYHVTKKDTIKLTDGVITYQKGEEIANMTRGTEEYTDRDSAEEKCVQRRINYLNTSGANITDVLFNSITYERHGVEYVDVVMLYDERGIERVETPRFCSKCGALMWEGYVDGDDYYCEECLPYSDEEWQGMYDEYPDYCYWTQWY